MTVRAKLVTRLVLLALAALLVVACAKPSDPPEPPYKGDLVLWVAPGLAGYPAASNLKADWFEGKAQAFARAGLHIRVERFAAQGELERALRDANFGGRPAPDLTFGRYLPDLAPKLTPIQSLLGQQGTGDILSNGFKAFSNGDDLLGLPVLLEVQVLALNEQAFTDAGVSLPGESGWTYEQFESTLKQLSGNGRFGLGFYDLPGFPEWYPLADGLVTPDGAIAPGAEGGLARLKRYREQGWLHPETAKLKAEETWALFAQKSPAIAIMPVSAWAIPLLRAEPFQVKLATAGFPGGMTVGSTYGFLFPKQGDPARLRAAVDLARFIAAPDRQVELARMTGLMPANKGAGNPFEQDPALTRAYLLASTQHPLPGSILERLAEPAIAQELRLTLLGAKEPALALGEVQKLLSTAITPTIK